MVSSKKMTKTQMKMQMLMRKAAGISTSIAKSLSTDEEKYFVVEITAMEWASKSCLFNFDFSEARTGTHREVMKTVTLSEKEQQRIEGKRKEW